MIAKQPIGGSPDSTAVFIDNYLPVNHLHALLETFFFAHFLIGQANSLISSCRCYISRYISLFYYKDSKVFNSDFQVEHELSIKIFYFFCRNFSLQSFRGRGKIAMFQVIEGVLLVGQDFLREVRMTKKVRSKKLKGMNFVFWLDFVWLFTFTLLFSCTMLLVGCNNQRSGAAGTSQIEKIPAEQRKAALLKTLDRKFENPDAHFELGRLYHAERLWIKAEYHYSRTISFDPAHREAQAAMVKLFFDSGDTAKAKIYADIYMKQVAGSASESFRLGFAFQKQLLDEYAMACFKQALNLAPNSAKVHRQIGYYYLSKNDKVRAEEYLKRSFQLDPLQPEVAGELGRLGVEVRIPKKIEKQTKKLDRIAEESRK